MTEQTVIDEWRERRDLTHAVKERVDHQLRALGIKIAPTEHPDADIVARLAELQFELSQLREAHDEAEEKYLKYSRGEGLGAGGTNHA